MPEQSTRNAEKVLAGDNNNNAPIATGSFKKPWNHIFSALSPQQHDTHEDQLERGEYKTQAKGTMHVVEGSHEEDAEAQATALDGRLAEATKGQQHSPFSSSAFGRLPQPVPVVDVFFGSWWLVSALRTAVRPAVIYLSVSWIGTTFFDTLVSTVIVAIYLLRWGLLKAGRDTIPLIGAPIPAKRQLFWVLFRWIQKIWVCLYQGFLKLLGMLTFSNRSIS